jgi:hypothetical protein
MIVKPVDFTTAKKLCEDHPHAGTLPNSSKYYMVAYYRGKPMGLAVWGYGIVPRQTPRKLFGDEGKIGDYLELCRFFVYDDAPLNAASQFLSITHKILKKHTKRKWLYTYAAGFQGLIGTIYQAANYDFIGKTLCNAFIYVPNVGLIHSIAQWHRYGKQGLKHLSGIYPGAKLWCGYNFKYIYWLCDKKEKQRLMNHAKFEIQPYPSKEDLEIWLEDKNKNKEPLSPQFAKTIPIVKLTTKRKAG